MVFVVLETERLVLRPWEDSDAEALYKYASDPEVGPAAGWPVHTSVQMSREVIRDILCAPETYAIVLRETAEPVGSIGLMEPRLQDVATTGHALELGYWIGKPYWGRGFVPEAAWAVIARAFGDLGCDQLWCAHYDGNRKSARVQEKLGFAPHHVEDHGRVEHWQVYRGCSGHA